MGPEPMVGGGPVVIAFDGTPAAEQAVSDGGKLLGSRSAIVVCVYKQGLGLELVELPTATLALPPAPIDIRTARQIDQSVYEGARRTAELGAELAREAGFDAEGLAVADEVETPVSETITEIARERDAQAIVIGSHRHGRLAILGSVSRDVIRHAPCPAIVVRDPRTEDEQRHARSG